MQYNFVKVSENLPKNATRSKRTLKRMHLKEFAVVLVDIIFPIDNSNLSNDKIDSIFDVIFEHDDGSLATAGFHGGFSILFEIPVSKFSEDYVKEYCTKLLFDLSNIDMEFAKIESINVQYGDAYYGEW